MKEIYKVLALLTYWLYGRNEEEGNVETILGLDWLWTGKFFEFDFEAWIKILEVEKEESLDSKLEKNLMFLMEMKDEHLERLKIAYEALVFLEDERKGA